MTLLALLGAVWRLQLGRSLRRLFFQRHFEGVAAYMAPIKLAANFMQAEPIRCAGSVDLPCSRLLCRLCYRYRPYRPPKRGPIVRYFGTVSKSADGRGETRNYTAVGRNFQRLEAFLCDHGRRSSAAVTDCDLDLYT